jgi:hypothetical protein
MNGGRRDRHSWLLGSKLRNDLRPRIRRHRAFSVSIRHRRLIRTVWTFLAQAIPGWTEAIRVIPLSSLEWTSECRLLGRTSIIVFDVEQANALGLLASLVLQRERPIYHQMEFLIRASEMLLSLGEIEYALLCTQQNFSELSAYAIRTGTYPDLQRPKTIYFDNFSEFSGILNQVIPGFVLAHEIGHAIFRQSTPDNPIWKRIVENWQHDAYEDDGSGLVFPRFERPDVEMYFNEAGLPTRCAIKGLDKVEHEAKLQTQMKEELFADFFAFCATSHIARIINISPRQLFLCICLTLETSERLLILRRLVARISRGAARSVVRFEAPTVPSRIYGLMSLIRQCCDQRGDHIPKSVSSFWRDGDQSFREMIYSTEAELYFESMADYSNIVARAGLHLGAGGLLSSAPVLDHYESMRAFAGSLRFLHAPNDVSQHCVTMAANDEWSSEDLERGVENPELIGFCCAVARLTEALVYPKVTLKRIGNTQVKRGRLLKNDMSALAMFVREPRLIARNQTLNHGA